MGPFAHRDAGGLPCTIRSSPSRNGRKNPRFYREFPILVGSDRFRSQGRGRTAVARQPEPMGCLFAKEGSVRNREVRRVGPA